MNKSNPFVPQGSLFEQQSKRRSRVKLGVFCVLTVSVAGLVAMLIQGCKREPVETTESTPQIDTNPPPFVVDNTNPSPAPVTEPSNPPVPPPPPEVVTPTPAPAVEPTGTEYVIVQGDYIEKIAKKFGVSTKAVMAANPGIVPTKLKVGQKIMIPPATSSAAPAATTSSSGMGEGIYVVKSGDTLTKIAKMHGTTIKAIESENNLTTTKIKVGQKLKIPVKAEAAAPAPAPEPAPAAPMVTPLPAPAK